MMIVDLLAEYFPGAAATERPNVIGPLVSQSKWPQCRLGRSPDVDRPQPLGLLVSWSLGLYLTPYLRRDKVARIKYGILPSFVRLHVGNRKV